MISLILSGLSLIAAGYGIFWLMSNQTDKAILSVALAILFHLWSLRRE
jgi:hypothetical protein